MPRSFDQIVSARLAARAAQRASPPLSALEADDRGGHNAARGACGRGGRAVHLLTAFDQASRVALAQQLLTPPRARPAGPGPAATRSYAALLRRQQPSVDSSFSVTAIS